MLETRFVPEATLNVYIAMFLDKCDGVFGHLTLHRTTWGAEQT